MLESLFIVSFHMILKIRLSKYLVLLIQPVFHTLYLFKGSASLESYKRADWFMSAEQVGAKNKRGSMIRIAINCWSRMMHDATARSYNLSVCKTTCATPHRDNEIIRLSA